MKHRALTLFVLGLIAASSAAQTFKTFDAPNAGTISGSGTYPTAINARGVITGYTFDNDYKMHGFIMGGGVEPIAFDALGTVPSPGKGTMPLAINDFGDVTGAVIDQGCAGGTCWHGFIRKANGTFIRFEALGGGEIICPVSINNFGVVTGYYYDQSAPGQVHQYAFYLVPNGKVTPFADNAFPGSINDFGIIAGKQKNPSSDSAPWRGFVLIGRKLTTFEIPGATDNSQGNAFINDFGVIAGTYPARLISPEAFPYSASAGFIRTPNGKFTFFASPAGPTKSLVVTAMNIFATTTGWYAKEEGTSFAPHAFVRFADGKLIVIKTPVEDEQSFSVGVNARGVVTGWWYASGEPTHGFTWVK